MNMGGAEGLTQQITFHIEAKLPQPKLPLATATPTLPTIESSPKDAQALEQARAIIKEASTVSVQSEVKQPDHAQSTATSPTTTEQKPLEEPDSPVLNVIRGMDKEVAQINEKASALADRLKTQANDTINRIAQKFQDPAWREQATAFFANQSDRLAQGAENRWADTRVALIKLNRVSEQYLARLLTEGPLSDIMGGAVEGAVQNILQKAIQLFPYINNLPTTLPIKL